MQAEELERFMKENGSILPLSPHDKIALRIRRRRRSIARHLAMGSPWIPVTTRRSSSNGNAAGASAAIMSPAAAAAASGGAAHLLQAPVHRILVLGDDCHGKTELATFLSASGEPSNATSAAVSKTSSPHTFAVKQMRMSYSTDNEQAGVSHSEMGSDGHCLVEVLVPPTDASAQSLRIELMQHCDIIVLVYSITQPETLTSVETMWQQEIDEGNLLRRREGGMLLRGAPSAGRRGEAEHDGLEHTVPPLLLIGMDAEVRQQQPHSHQQHGSTSSSSSVGVGVTSSKAAVHIAQQLHATKYIEVFTRKPAHYKSVWAQLTACLLTYQQEQRKVAAYSQDHASPKGNITPAHYVSGCPLYEHLRPEPPTLSVDANTHQVCVQHHGDELSRPMNADPLTLPPGQRVVFAYALDVREEGTPAPPIPGADVSPAESWFLSSASRVPASGRVDLRATPPLPKRFAAVTLARGMFPSVEAVLDLPRQSHLPAGFIDVATRTFQLKLPPEVACSSSAVAMLGVRYTLDGTEPTMTSPLYLGPVDLMPFGTEQSGLYAPWPSHAPPPPRVVRYACLTSATFRSDTATVDVPGVLDTPHVVISTHDRSLRVEGTLNPLALYRYTVDGSAPSYTNGIDYTRPVTLPAHNATDSNRGGIGAMPQVRFVCLPRLFFPSEEVIVTTTSAQTPSKQHAGRPRQQPQQRSGSPSAPHTSWPDRTVAIERVRLSLGTPTGGGRSRTPTGVTQESEDFTPRRSVATASPQRQATNSNNVFATTRTATIRAELNHTRRQQQQKKGEQPVMLVAPGSRGASPIVRSRGSTPERSASPPSKPKDPGIQRWASTPERSNARRETLDASPQGVDKKSAPFHRRLGATTNAVEESQVPKGGTAVGCVAAENEVEFAFPSPISLSHVTVATPGGGQGPRSYEVFVVLADTESWMGVGSGDLDDKASVQCMSVVPSARMMPVVKVRCVFGGPMDGENVDEQGGVGRRPRSFIVRDMKIHGKPFTSSR